MTTPWLVRIPRNRQIAVCLAVIVLFSVPAFFTRFLNDMDYYSHVADKLLNGGVLYRDTIDTKPPFVFVHYALIFRLFGENDVAAVKIVTMAVLAITALTMPRIRKELSPAAENPELTALLFALASFSGWGEEFLSSNTEILANLFIVAGVYWMVKDHFDYHPGRLILGGALVGVAFLYRFQSGAVLGAYTVLLRLRRGEFPQMVPRLMWLGAGFLIPIAALISYYAWTGGLQYLQAFLRYGFSYLRSGSIYWPGALTQIAVVVVSLAHFLFLAAWQVVRLLRKESLSTGDLFLLLFFGFSLAPFFVGGRFFAHYIVQTIPALVLLAAGRLTGFEDVVAMVRWGARAGRRYLRAAPVLLPLHVVLFGAVNGAYYWRTREPRNAYPNLVRFVREHSTKRDPVYVWTSRTHVLFDMDRVYATRFISNDFLVGRIYGTRHRKSSETADSAREASVIDLWPVLLEDLRAAPPVLIIDDTRERSSFTLDHYPELLAFVRGNYEPCRVVDQFCVYVRKGREALQ
jgi:hypothetical protein